MSRKIGNDELDGEVDVDLDGDPQEFALWYRQAMQLGEARLKKIRDTALKRLKESKPEAYEFIRKFKCELVGLQPGVQYCLIEEWQGEMGVTFIHQFSMPTLLFWCEDGGFGFFVNANLKYNDTVLNQVPGNRNDRGIKGFTG